MGEDFDWKVKQILAEIERMRPDIEAEVNKQFADQEKALAESEQGTMGNVQASKLGKHGPAVSDKEAKGIAERFQKKREEIASSKADLNKKVTGTRIGFLSDRYFEGAGDDEKATAIEAVNKSLFPTSPEPEKEAAQGYSFDPDSFDYSESVNEDYENLTDEFNDNAPPPPSNDLEP